jgi:hypothetical protein
LLFAALVLWLGGGAPYLWIITLIFFRYTFVHVAPEDFTPPYWINIGAVAISALVGATLIEHAALSRDATLWIPMLLVLGVWRYLIRGVPIAYDPLHWGRLPVGHVFRLHIPLGKDTGGAVPLPLSQLFMVIAVLAWAATFAGLVDSRINRLSRAIVRPKRAGLANVLMGTWPRMRAAPPLPCAVCTLIAYIATQSRVLLQKFRWARTCSRRVSWSLNW